MTAFAPSATARLFHLAERQLAGFGQALLVGRRTSADDVANAGEHVAEDVGADDGLAGDDAEIPADGPAFNDRSRADEHVHDGSRDAAFTQPVTVRNRSGSVKLLNPAAKTTEGASATGTLAARARLRA